MVTNTLAKQEARETVSSFLTKPANRARINAMMDAKTGNQFITSIVAAVNQNLDLQECDNLSIMSAAMQGQALKLSPSPVLGHFYSAIDKVNDDIEQIKGLSSEFEVQLLDLYLKEFRHAWAFLQRD